MGFLVSMECLIRFFAFHSRLRRNCARMAFTKTAEYALRAVAELARNTGVVNSDELSIRTQVPRPYLMKVLQEMQGAGLVESTRGKTGGWRLNGQKAEFMTMYDVMQAVDPIVRIHTCPLALPEHAEKLCPLHEALDAVFEKMERDFKAAKVMQLVDKSVSLDRLVAGLSATRCPVRGTRGRVAKS